MGTKKAIPSTEVDPDLWPRALIEELWGFSRGNSWEGMWVWNDPAAEREDLYAAYKEQFWEPHGRLGDAYEYRFVIRLYTFYQLDTKLSCAKRPDDPKFYIIHDDDLTVCAGPFDTAEQCIRTYAVMVRIGAAYESDKI